MQYAVSTLYSVQVNEYEGSRFILAENTQK